MLPLERCNLEVGRLPLARLLKAHPGQIEIKMKQQIALLSGQGAATFLNQSVNKEPWLMLYPLRIYKMLNTIRRSLPRLPFSMWPSLISVPILLFLFLFKLHLFGDLPPFLVQLPVQIMISVGVLLLLLLLFFLYILLPHSLLIVRATIRIVHVHLIQLFFHQVEKDLFVLRAEAEIAEFLLRIRLQLLHN